MVDRTRRPEVPVVHADEIEHRRQLAVKANAALSKDGTDGMTAPLKLAPYTTASLPDATLWEGALVYNSDDNAPSFSDGASWLDVHDWDLNGDFIFDSTKTDQCNLYAVEKGFEILRVSVDGEGPHLDFFSDSSTPGFGDNCGALSFYGRNSAAAKTLFAEMESFCDVETAGSEMGGLGWSAMVGGTFALMYELLGINVSGGDFTFAQWLSPSNARTANLGLSDDLDLIEWQFVGASSVIINADTDITVQADSLIVQCFATTNNYMQFSEIADPAAAAANSGRLYVRDNGAGKSQFVARFPSGAVQVIATEP